MSRLRVAYVTHSVDPLRGGMERISASLLEGLSAHVDLEVVAGDGLSALPLGVRRTHVASPSAPSVARLGVFAVVGTLRMVAVRRRCDLVHSNGIVQLLGSDVVTVHLSHLSVIEDQGSARPPGTSGIRAMVAASRRRLAAGMERRGLRQPSIKAIVALSASDKERLAARLPAARIEVIPDGVEVQRFTSMPRVPRGEALRVLVVAGDPERKRVDLALEAVATCDGVRLRIVGVQDDRSLRASAERLGIADRVDFEPWRADIERVYASSDVALSCSSHESFALWLVEAALGGCAVLATPTGIAPDLVASGAGRIVEQDADSIASALRWLRDDPAALSQCASRARDAAEQYSVERMVERTLALYESISGTRT